MTRVSPQDICVFVNDEYVLVREYQNAGVRYFIPFAQGELAKTLMEQGLDTRLVEEPFGQNRTYVVLKDPALAAFVKLRFGY